MNKINYDKVLTDTIAKLNGTVPTLLLNVCCAPCLTYCIIRLAPYFDITLYYDNDNITADSEWQKRLDEVIKLKELVNNGQYEVNAIRPIKLIVPERDTNRYFNATKGHESAKEGGSRCYKCYELRINRLAEYATQHNFDYYTTTLSISPYKNSSWINELGANSQIAPNTKWLYSDFKKQEGYKQSIELSNKYGIYRQHYCGCVFSQNNLATQSEQADTNNK